MGVDQFLAMFPHHWAGHPRGPGPGFWYEDSVDDDGRPRARIRYGDAGQCLLAGMRAAVRALLDTGNDVILDEMPLDETIVPSWRGTLAGYDSFWVRLTAPQDTVEERELRRPSGQHLGNARGHHQLTDTATVDLIINTATAEPRDAAAAILRQRPW